MAVFELNDEETWLPAFARGMGLKIEKIRVNHSTLGRQELVIPAAPALPRVTVTDERAIRHLRADARFTEII